MRSTTRAIVTISFLLALSAAAPAQGTWKGTIVKEGDVTIIKNPKEPLYKTPVLELAEDLSLGGPDAQGDSVFDQIRSFVIDDDGAIYVPEYRNSQIKVFDDSGRYLRTIGRKGQGPGELEMARVVSINRTAGELAVLQMSRRISFFKLDGTFLRHVSFKEIWALYGRVDSRGRIYVTEGIVDPESPRYALKKLGPDGTVLTTLATTPAPAPSKFDPFLAVAWWLLDRNDNLVYGYPETYEIQIYDAESAKVVRRIVRDYDPVAVTDEEREEERKGTPPNIKLNFSKDHAAYSRFFLSDQGHIIVQTYEKADGGRFIHDVFDAEGRFLGLIPLKPFGVGILKGKYYALEEDEEGYQYVKRYAVTWMAR